MKKKILLSLLTIFSAFCLSGCHPSSESIDNLLSALQKEEIVDKELKLIDTVTKVSTSLFLSKTTYYIYENQDSKLIAINYDTNIYAKNDYDYSVAIFYDVSINDKIEYLDDEITPESYYAYQDGKKSEFNKYNLENITNYIIYESKPLFSKTKYTIEEVK